MRSISKFLFLAVGLICLTPYVDSAIALLLGISLALVFGNPYAAQTKQLTHKFLALAVIGLGAGMDLMVVSRVGMHGIGYTVLGISFAFAFGTLLGKVLRIGENTSLLVTAGTAICGGSAIAAIAPIIRAKPHETSVALGTVFLLNAVALFLFPWIGHALNLTETQFGLWSALAIHDTSSVVGATLKYGSQALAVGTTVKLARALWIFPVAALVGHLRSRRQVEDSATSGPAKRPWFIVGFLLMAALVTWVPSLSTVGHQIEWASKRLMVLTLFLIGSNLTRETLKAVGVRPLVMGVGLWLIVGSGSLAAIYYGLIA